MIFTPSSSEVLLRTLQIITDYKSSKQLYEIGIVIIAILDRRKLRHRKLIFSMITYLVRMKSRFEIQKFSSQIQFPAGLGTPVLEGMVRVCWVLLALEEGQERKWCVWWLSIQWNCSVNIINIKETLKLKPFNHSITVTFILSSIFNLFLFQQRKK